MTFKKKESKPFKPEEVAAHQYVIALESGYELSYKRELQVFSAIHLGDILEEVPELKDEARALGEELTIKLREFSDKFVNAFLKKIENEISEENDDTNDE